MNYFIRLYNKLFIPVIAGFALNVCYANNDTSQFSFPNSRNINFRNIDASSGLSYNFCTAICQDNSGFMWIGSFKGLNKFDGTNFVQFRHNASDSGTISNDRIRKMIFDKNEDYLYFTTPNGFNKINIRTEKITRYYHNKNDSNSLGDNSCNAVCQDKNGGIWIGAWEGTLNYLANANAKLRSFKPAFPHKPITITTIFCDNLGTLWIGTRGSGMASMSTLDTLGTFNYFTTADGLISNHVTSFFIDSEKRMFILSSTGIQIYDKSSKSFRKINPVTIHGKYPLTKIQTWKIVEDNNNRYWISTANGIVVMDKSLKICEHILPDIHNKNGLQSRYTTSLFIDAEDNVWISSQKGLSIYNDLLNQFEVIDYNPGRSKVVNLSNTSYSSIVNANVNAVTIALHNGYVSYNKNTKKITELPPISKNYFPEILQIKDSFGNAIINGLVGSGFYLKKAGTEQIINLNKNNSKGINSNYYFKIYCDSKDNFWMLSEQKGVSRFQVRTNSISNYQYNKNDTNTVCNNWPYNITEDFNGNIWVASWMGISKYHRTKDNFQRFLFEKYPIVYQIHIQNDSIFWLATSAGLVEYNAEKNIVLNEYTEKDGLKDNVVYSILPDEEGNLWVNSASGINCFNLNTKSIVYYGILDGLKGSAFLHNSYFKDFNDILYFGTTEGLSYFKPSDIFIDSVFVTPIITGVKLFNKPIQHFTELNITSEISHVDNIKLTYKQNMISFEFSSLNYIRPGKIRYRYMLEGFDKDWIDAGKHRSVSYTNLAHGSYNFKVQASNRIGNWNGLQAEIALSITPPFWKTFLFRILVAFAILMLAIIIVRINNLLLIRKKRELERQVEARTNEIKENQKKIEKQKEQLARANTAKSRLLGIMAHDLKNTFNSIQGFSDIILFRHKKLLDKKVSGYITHIREGSFSANMLLENILQWSKSEEAKKYYQPNVVDLSKIIEECIQHQKTAAKAKNIEIVFYDNKPYTAFCDKNMVQTIIRNLLSNAIKYSYRDKEIKVMLKQHNRDIVISVSDSGVGISEERKQDLFDVDCKESERGTENEKGTGFGLVLCKDFVQQNNGKIWVESEMTKGSTFCFTLPMEKVTNS